MWKIRKDHIKLAEVIILDYFLQRYTVVRSPIHEFLQLAQSTLRNQRVELQYSFITSCRKSFLKTYSYLINSLSPSITCRTFVARNIYINGEKAVISATLHDILSTNSSNFCRQVLWLLCRGRGTWRREWETLRTCPGCSVLDP